MWKMFLSIEMPIFLKVSVPVPPLIELTGVPDAPGRFFSVKL